MFLRGLINSYLKLLIKHSHELTECRAMLSKDVASIIISLHVIMGSDHASGFYGHGKEQGGQ